MKKIFHNIKEYIIGIFEDADCVDVAMTILTLSMALLCLVIIGIFIAGIIHLSHYFIY